MCSQTSNHPQQPWALVEQGDGRMLLQTECKGLIPRVALVREVGPRGRSLGIGGVLLKDKVSLGAVGKPHSEAARPEEVTSI